MLCIHQHSISVCQTDSTQIDGLIGMWLWCIGVKVCYDEIEFQKLFNDGERITNKIKKENYQKWKVKKVQKTLKKFT